MRVIGERLREARKLRCVSQTKLAELIGTSPNQVSMIEHEQSGTSGSRADNGDPIGVQAIGRIASLMEQVDN